MIEDDGRPARPPLHCENSRVDIGFDLTAEQEIPRDAPDEVLGFAELTNAARTPSQLARILWGRRHERIVLHEDELPKSAKQAAAALLAGVSRAKRRTIVAAGSDRDVSAAGLLGHGIAELAVAAPRELRDSYRLRREALSDCAVDRDLPRRIPEGRVESVLYVRGNPAMRWKGHAVGGAITHMTGVVNGMVDDGVEVTVLAAAGLPELRALVREVSVRRVFHFEPWLTLASYSEEIEAAAAGIDVDVVYQRYEPGSLAGLRIASELDVPLIVEYNGSEIWVDRNWGAAKKASRGHEVLERIEQRTLEQASQIVVVSEPLREELLGRGIADDRILVNPNGVDTAALAPYREGTPRDWRARSGLPDAPTIGFIGTFGFWHGVLELPEMVERVADGTPEARWVIVGDGQHHGDVQTDLLRRGLQDKVSMPGALPRADALELLAGSDVVVSPHVPNPDGSRFFGSPTKLFEYMGLAKPIVASDLEQIGEVVIDGETGLLHAPGDTPAAAALVEQLLGDEELRARLGAGALARAEELYTWRSHSARILAAVNEDDR